MTLLTFLLIASIILFVLVIANVPISDKLFKLLVLGIMILVLLNGSGWLGNVRLH